MRIAEFGGGPVEHDVMIACMASFGILGFRFATF